MRYRLLGRSGLRVSELSLGTMTFGEEWGWGAPKEESRRIFDAYAEAGGNFLDTANRYTEGTSERWVGEFVAADRDHFVVATKYTLKDRDGDPNFAGNGRKNLVRSLDASLKRMGLEHVDLLWVHAWDERTPAEEVMRALDDQVRAGKVQYVGVSDTPAWVVSRANLLAEMRGWTPFVALQIEWSLIQRTVERELVPMAGALGMAVTPWGVLGGGVLSGKYASGGAAEGEGGRIAAGHPRRSERNLAIAAEAGRVAEETGRTPSQVALAWLRARPGNVIPILGARRLAQLEDNLGCLDFALEGEHLRRLDEASRIEMGFPREMLETEATRGNVHAGTFHQVEIR